MRIRVVSTGASAVASAGRAWTRPAAQSAFIRSRRRMRASFISWLLALAGGCARASCHTNLLELELLLELVERAPVRSVTNDLLRWTIHHPRFAQPQRVETQRVLRVVLAPVAVRNLPQRLPRVLRRSREALIEIRLRAAVGIGGADLA